LKSNAEEVERMRELIAEYKCLACGGEILKSKRPQIPDNHILESLVMNASGLNGKMTATVTTNRGYSGNFDFTIGHNCEHSEKAPVFGVAILHKVYWLDS
jgi:hypothetical protein